MLRLREGDGVWVEEMLYLLLFEEGIIQSAQRLRRPSRSGTLLDLELCCSSDNPSCGFSVGEELGRMEDDACGIIYLTVRSHLWNLVCTMSTLTFVEICTSAIDFLLGPHSFRD